jgi:hypothetical protein
MNDLGGRPPHLLHDIMHGAEQVGARPPARLRAGTIVAATALLLIAGAAFTALPVLAHRMSATAARPMAAMMPAATPRPPAATPTAPPAMVAAATARPAAKPAMTMVPPMPATQLTVGPGMASGFAQTGQWNAGAGGSPGFTGPGLWVSNGAGTARWNLGSPNGGHGWDQVRVMAWIPNMHALAWVRYTVTSTSMGIATTRTFDVSQQALNGWYILPATFAIGTATQRTGTIMVSLTYLRPYPPTANNGGCEMAAAQMRFMWS